MYNDLPSKRKVGMGIVGWSVTIILAFFVVGLVVTGLKWVMAPVNMATGIVERVINADHALESYRWFHSANQQVRSCCRRPRWKRPQRIEKKHAASSCWDSSRTVRRSSLTTMRAPCAPTR